MYINLFIELELNTHILFGISSEVSFLIEMTASLTKVFYSARSTLVKSIDTEVANNEGTCTESSCTRATNIKSAGRASIKSASVRNADWDVLLTQPSLSNDKCACIKDASIGDTCGQIACISDTFTRGAYASVGAIIHLRRDLRSFWILDVKLFGTRLEIGIGVCW